MSQWDMTSEKTPSYDICQRFRGFLPVVVDVETAGFDPEKDALLEVAAVLIKMDDEGVFSPGPIHFFHINPFPGARLDPCSLKFTGIDPYHPFRFAISEQDALTQLFGIIKAEIKTTKCQRAVLVGHNAHFDLDFIKAAAIRCGIKHPPFHRFTVFDTATLSGLVYGQTVLAKSLESAGFTYDSKEAHSALYDAEQTANLFCTIVNRWREFIQKAVT